MKTAEILSVHEKHEQQKRILRNNITCPITLFIFKEPVLLIPENPNLSDASFTATIELDAYNSMRPKRCPITRIAISGCTRNGTIKSLVESYLSAYPEERGEQYQSVNHHAEDIESVTPVTQAFTHSTSRLMRASGHSLFSSLPHDERHVLNRQNTEVLQSTYITKIYNHRADIASFTAGFLLFNIYIVLSNMLGACINESDVHKTGLATAVGSPALTTLGFLIVSFPSLKSYLTGAPEPIESFVHYIGGGVLISALFISGITGQYILDGKLDSKTLEDLVINSTDGMCAGMFTILPVLYALARFGQGCYTGLSSCSSDTTAEVINSSEPARTYGTMAI
ncbi:MAG: hypothetical protein P1U36_06895 [Legionellaceae bacterium]|nr:hypothetical protein [Legionellaceae bacterium]